MRKHRGFFFDLKQAVAFLNKALQKSSPPGPAMVKTSVSLGQTFFAELFFKKATAFFAAERPACKLPPPQTNRRVGGATSEQRFLALDGLRGLACLMVLFSHFVIAFYETLLDGLSAHSHAAWDQALSHSTLILLYNPRTGVAIFFVLSGFVLSSSVAEYQPPWLALAIRRWIRLCLPVLVLTPFCWAALHAGAFRDCQAVAAITRTNWLNHFYPPVSYWISLRLCVYNVFFTFFTGSPGAIQIFIGTIWTLPIELLGSLGLFGLYCLGADVFRRARGCFGVSLLAILVTWNTPYYGFGLGLALFETRRGISYFTPSWRQRLSRAANPLGLAALVAGIWFGGTPFALAGAHLWFLETAERLGIPLGIKDMQQAGAFLLVAAALLFRPFQRLLCARLCQYLGRISFMLFLVQNPVICAVPLWVFLHTGQNYHLRAMATLAAYLALSIASADIATRWVDRPSIRLSRLATLPPAMLWGKGRQYRARGRFFVKKLLKKLL